MDFSAKKPFMRLKLDLQLTHPLTWLVTGMRGVGTGKLPSVNINLNVNINVCYSILTVERISSYKLANNIKLFECYTIIIPPKTLK